MYIVRISLLGDVSFQTPSQQPVGYLFDVPFDQLFLPYLPLRRYLEKEGVFFPAEVHIGIAHPDGYLSLISTANKLLKTMPESASFIRSYFTTEHFVPEMGANIRCLKAGQTFIADITFPNELVGTIRQTLSGVRHLGAREAGITGEVILSLEEVESQSAPDPTLSPLQQYHALDYSLMLLTPACIYAPYQDGMKTLDYIPGELIKEELQRYAGHLESIDWTQLNVGHPESIDRKQLSVGHPESIDWSQLTCSNAYINDGKGRLFPMPSAATFVKLDREQFRYRLASGKDPHIVEQDVGLNNTFTGSVSGHLTEYTIPETEHILSTENQIYDALSAGQIFSGTIYGPDPMLRFLAHIIKAHPTSYIGVLSDEGFGTFYHQIDALREAPLPADHFVTVFDVCCISDTILINDEGMPTCQAEDLLAEIEYRLGDALHEHLSLIGKYTSVCQDNSIQPRWGTQRAVTRCIAKGSILRLAAKGAPVDISPIIHCFLGERTCDGYGEILSWPATDRYYRLARQIPPAVYSLQPVENARSMKLAADLAAAIMRAMLKTKVTGLAISDRQEYARGYSIEALIPLDILHMLRDRYDPLLPEDTMLSWYTDALKGGTDETE